MGINVGALNLWALPGQEARRLANAWLYAANIATISDTVKINLF